MTGTVYFANGTVYYIDNAGCAKFNSLDTAGATSLGSTLGVTGATTLSSTLAVTGATTLSSTLAVTDTATMYHVIPADDNTTYELGSATARWKKLHIGTADTYGSATQPIWWSDGKPAECTSYANAAVKSAGEFTSAQSVTLTGDVTGTTSSKAGWSIAATAWKLTPHEHDATYVAAATAPTDYNGKLIFTGMKTNTTLGITSELTYSYVIGLRGYSSKSGGGSHEFAFNDSAIYHRMSSTGADTWSSWNMLVRSAAGGATGSATEPVWVNSAGIITACTSYANANVKTAATWTTARTLTIGATGKSVNGSANVSWSMDEIMGSSDSTKFYRGDKTWSNTISNEFIIARTTTDWKTGAKLTFNTTMSSTTGYSYIASYQTPTATNYNESLVIVASGGCFIGGGEGAETIHQNVITGTGTEDLYLCPDGVIRIYTGADNKTQRAIFDTSSQFYPATNNSGSIGISSNKWANMYATTFNGDLSGNATTATKLAHTTLNSTTINNTAGSFAFSGSGDPWSGTDWVGLQIGDNVDKFQISANGNTLVFRQNDNGGTNTSWSDWVTMLTSANYTSYTVTKTGSGASGTWGINISGRLTDSAHSWTATEVYDYMMARVLKAGDTMTGNLIISKDGDTYFEVKCPTTGVRLELDNSGSTNHGLWSSGYWNGSAYTASASWMIYRNASGTNIVNGNCTGNAGSATRINGNLAQATSDANRNIWVSSTTSADGIPNYVTTFTMNPSTKTLHIPSGGRIDANGGALYLGNSGNQSWVYVQDMASQASGTPWKLTQAGALTCASINDTGAATISGGITSQHGHVFNVGGNEFNWIPDGYNSTMWFNYESFGRTNNSTVSEYICGNGKHGHANLRAAKVYNAVWNDFAEYREGTTTEAGRVVAATTDSNKVSLTTKRLQPCAHVISDTFGCSVGESDTAKTPIGVAGRVLVFPYRPIEEYSVGDCLCAAPGGTADIMTREEIIMYPDRIIGVVDEIPKYKIWNQILTTAKPEDKDKIAEGGSGQTATNIEVNGRIWIYAR